MRYAVLIPLLIVAASVTAEAREIRLYGAPIRRADYVAGTVKWVHGRDVAFDMGYVQGVLRTHRFLVYRRENPSYRLIGMVSVDMVRRRFSVGTSSTRQVVRPGDAVIIAARELAIWNATGDRFRDEYQRRKNVTPRSGNYDTRDTGFDAIDRLERRPRNRLKLVEWSRRLDEIRTVGPALWDLSQVESRRRGFIQTLRVFGTAFGYRNKEIRGSEIFEDITQPIQPISPGESPEPVVAATAAAPAAAEPAAEPQSVADLSGPALPPPRVDVLARRISEYLGRIRASR